MENNSTWTPSQPSPTSWQPKPFAAGPSVLFAVGTAACMFLPAIAYGIVAVLIGHIDLAKPVFSPEDLLYSQLLAYGVVLPYLLFFLPRVAHASLADLGIRIPTWRQVGIGVAGTAAMFLAVNGTAAAIVSITHLHGTEASVQLLQQMKTPFEKTLFILIAAVFAPIVEELAFRAFLFSAFARYVPFATAALLSGVLFGLVHVQSKEQLITLAIPLALGGVVLAAVYRYSRCYWSNVITHGLFNSISLVAVFGFHVKS